MKYEFFLYKKYILKPMIELSVSPIVIDNELPEKINKPNPITMSWIIVFILVVIILLIYIFTLPALSQKTVNS